MFQKFGSAVDAIKNGQQRFVFWRKSPSAVTVAGLWFDMALSPGQPAPIYYAGSPQTNLQIAQSTDGGIYHGKSVSPSKKYLYKTLLTANAATGLPMTVLLCDLLMAYPFCDEAADLAVAQSMTNNFQSLTTFTASTTTDLLTHSNIMLPNLARVQVSSTTTLPAGLSASTDYFVIRESSTTCRLATSLVNARANVFVDITDTGTGTHSIKSILPRYIDGSNVQVMAICVAAGAGVGGTTFNFQYTNQDGVSGRNSQTVTMNTGIANGQIITSVNVATAAGAVPFIPLQAGDSGVQSIESYTILTGGDIGLFTLVMVRPLAETMIYGIDAPVECEHYVYKSALPQIYDEACLGIICNPNGALNATIVSGTMNFVYT
jgi:hypothetical protein